jgi:hypothetical protein
MILYDPKQNKYIFQLSPLDFNKKYLKFEYKSPMITLLPTCSLILILFILIITRIISSDNWMNGDNKRKEDVNWTNPPIVTFPTCNYIDAYTNDYVKFRLDQKYYFSMLDPFRWPGITGQEIPSATHMATYYFPQLRFNI